jgi:hypothetical protein
LYIASQEMPLGQHPEEDVTICELIEIQRMLARSKDPFERVVGALFVAVILDMRLGQLTDRQIGQLMFDYFGHDLGILLPETTICDHATRRLFRSAGGSFTTEDWEKQRQRPCPRCGNEMLPHVGIDGPDFRQCVLLKCGHKEPLGSKREGAF